MEKITDIVFDVGRVLFDFNYDALFRFLSNNGAIIKDIDDFVERVDLQSYELGQLSSEVFIDNLNSLLTHRVDRSELTAHWVEIFEPIDEMLKLAAYLNRKFRVFLLSNTSALHWDYLLSHYNLKTFGSGLLASFEIGALKPEAEIFWEAERRFGLVPERTIFIDDIETNALGASACGWHGIHHVQISKTKESLESLLMCPLP
ncbi:MAG: HAD-IA family hydrolase [Nitrospiria bacterium]